MAEERQELQYLLGADATQLLHVFNKVMKSADNMELSVVKAVEKMSGKSADSLDDFTAALNRYDKSMRDAANNSSHNGLERLTDKQNKALQELTETYDKYLDIARKASNPNFDRGNDSSAQALAVANSMAAKVLKKEMTLSNIKSYTKSLQTYMDKAAGESLKGKQKSSFDNTRNIIQKALKDYVVTGTDGKVDQHATAAAKRAAAVSFKNFQQALAQGLITEAGKNYTETRMVGDAAAGRIEKIERSVLKAMADSKWVASDDVKNTLANNIRTMLTDAFAKSMITMDDLANMDSSLAKGKNAADVVKNISDAYGLVKTNAKEEDKAIYQEFLNQYEGLVEAQTKASMGEAHKLTGEQTKILNSVITYAVDKGRRELEEYANKLHDVLARRYGNDAATEMTKVQVAALDKDLSAGVITDDTIRQFNEVLEYTLKGKMRMVIDALTAKYGDLQGYTGSKGTLSDGMINSMSKQEQKKMQEIIQEGQRIASTIDEAEYMQKSHNILESVSESMKRISVEAAETYSQAIDRILADKKLDLTMDDAELLKMFPELSKGKKLDYDVVDQSPNAKPWIDAMSVKMDPKALGADKDALLKKLEELRQVSMQHYKAFTTDKKPSEEGARAYAQKLFPDVPEGLNIQQIQEYILRKIATADMWSYIQNSRPNKSKNMYPYFGTHLGMDKGTSWGSKNVKLYDGGDRGMPTEYKGNTDKSAYKKRIDLTRQLVRTYNAQHQEKIARAKASYEHELDTILHELVDSKAAKEAKRVASAKMNTAKATTLYGSTYGDLMSEAKTYATDKYSKRKRKTSDPQKRAKEIQKYVDAYIKKAMAAIDDKDNFTDEELDGFQKLYDDVYKSTYDNTVRSTDTSQYLTKAKQIQEKRQQEREFQQQEEARLLREQRDQAFIDSFKTRRDSYDEQAATKQLEAAQEKIKRKAYVDNYMAENNLSGISGAKQGLLSYKKYKAQEEYAKNHTPALDEDLINTSREVSGNFQELTPIIADLTSHIHRLAQSVEKLVYSTDNKGSSLPTRKEYTQKKEADKLKLMKNAISQAKLYADGDINEYDRILQILINQIKEGKLEGLPQAEVTDKLDTMAREAVNDKDYKRTSRTKREQDERNKAIALLVARAKETATDTDELAKHIAELEAIRTSDTPLKSVAEIRKDIELAKAEEYINPTRPSKQMLPSELQDLKASEADTKRQDNMYRQVDAQAKRMMNELIAKSSTLTEQEFQTELEQIKSVLTDILSGIRDPESSAKASLEATMQKFAQMQTQGTYNSKGVEKPLAFKPEEVPLTGMAAAADSVRKSVDKLKKKYAELFGMVESGQNKTNSTIKKGAKKTADEVEQYFRRTASITSGILISQAFRSVANGISNASKELGRFITQMDSVNTSYEVMLGNAEQAHAVVFEIQRLAATTPYEVETSLEGVRKLLAYGFNAGESLEIMRKTADAMAVSGGDMTAMTSLLDAIGKINVKGKLDGKQLNALYSTGIPIDAFFEQQMGLSGMALSKAVSKGQVDANTAIEAILTGIEQNFPDGAKKMNRTISGLFSNIGDSLRYLGSTLFTDVTESFKDSIEAIANKLESLWDVTKTLGPGGLFEAVVPKEYHSTIRHTIGYFKVIGDSLKTIALNSGFLKHTFYSTFMVLNSVLNAIAIVMGSVSAAIKRLNENANTRKLVEGFTKLLGVVIGLTIIGKITGMFFKFISMASKLIGVHSLIQTVTLGFGVLTGTVSRSSEAIKKLNVVCAFLARNPIIMAITALVGGLYAVGSVADVITAKLGGIGKVLMWIPAAVYNAFNWLFSMIGAGFDNLYNKLFGMDFGSILKPEQIDMDAYYKALQDAMGGVSAGAGDAEDSLDDASKAAENFLQSFDEVFTIDPNKDSGGSGGSGGGGDFGGKLPNINDFITEGEVPDFGGDKEPVKPPDWKDILGLSALAAAIAAMLKWFKKLRKGNDDTKKHLKDNPIEVKVEAPVTQNVFEKLKAKVKEWNNGLAKNPINIPVYVPDMNKEFGKVYDKYKEWKQKFNQNPIPIPLYVPDVQADFGKVKDTVNQWKERFNQNPIPIPVYSTAPNFKPVFDAYEKAKLALNPIPIAVSVAVPVIQGALDAYAKLKLALQPIPLNVEVPQPNVQPVLDAFDVVTGAAPVAGVAAATGLVDNFNQSLKPPITEPVRQALDKMKEACKNTGRTTAEVYIGSMNGAIKEPNLTPVKTAADKTQGLMTTAGAATGLVYGQRMGGSIDLEAQKMPSILERVRGALLNTSASLGYASGYTIGSSVEDPMGAEMAAAMNALANPNSTAGKVYNASVGAGVALAGGLATIGFAPAVATGVSTATAAAGTAISSNTAVANAFSYAGTSAGGSFGSSFLTKLKTFGSSIWSWIKSLFNFGGGGAQPALGWSLQPPQGVAPATMSLPGYAKGGIITKEHIARVGEGNKREAVVPLENGSAMAPFAEAVAARIASKSSRSNPVDSGDVVLNVGVLVADDNGLRQLERKLQTIRKQETRRS